MNLDQKQPNFPEHILPEYFKSLGVDYRIVEADTYSVVKEKIPEGATTCSLCSRLRRGIIYTTAKQLGANKIALGHHRDDIVETLFLNMFFGAKMKAMPRQAECGDSSAGILQRKRYCQLRATNGVPDYSLRFMWQPAKYAAAKRESDVAKMGD
jgi:tRNA 2-thiocytidine biosynthesis protein TtcA